MDPGRINTKKITPRHMTIKLLKSKEKERILKAARERRHITEAHDDMVTELLVKTACVWLFVIPWTEARQAPLSMRSSRQEYWSGLLCLPPGYLPDPGMETRPPACRWILYSLSHREAPKQWRPKDDDKNQDNGDQTTWKSEKKQMSLLCILYILITK